MATMRILIADDSEIFVQRLKSSLAEVTGLEIVGHVDNGLDATLEIRKAKPDVVILDIHMPGASGIDVLKGLKKDQFQPIVIVLSNYSDRQYRKKCLESGARFFFDKSADFHEVVGALRGLMDAPPA
jgi:DNA-binding NarL/FixJ family response regulator